MVGSSHITVFVLSHSHAFRSKVIRTLWLISLSEITQRRILYSSIGRKRFCIRVSVIRVIGKREGQCDTRNISYNWVTTLGKYLVVLLRADFLLAMVIFCAYIRTS